MFITDIFADPIPAYVYGFSREVMDVEFEEISSELLDKDSELEEEYQFNFD